MFCYFIVLAVAFNALWSEAIPLEDVELGHCGRMGTIFEPGENKETFPNDDDDSGARIIGGFVASEPVPWFVSLKIGTANGTKEGRHCGGTLITNQFVLTAAHCMCNEYVKYCDRADHLGNITRASDAAIPIDIVALIGLIVPFNLKYITPDELNGRHIRFISRVVIQRDFNPIPSKGTTFPSGPDIALLKMNKPVPKYFTLNPHLKHALRTFHFSLSDPKSAPACLPAGSIFPDLPMSDDSEITAVIMGMGNLWDAYQSCSTTMGGPNPFQNCKFPFITPSKDVTSACARSRPTPSSGNTVCRSFHHQVSANGSAIFIVS